MEYRIILENIEKRAKLNTAIGASVKFKMDEHVFVVDGTGERNEIFEDDREADCTIITSIKNMGKMMEGELNPMMATMMGKLKIKGDMGVAMKLQNFL